MLFGISVWLWRRISSVKSESGFDVIGRQEYNKNDMGDKSNMNDKNARCDLRFDEKGLIPAIVVDAETKQVLTLAYMNRESFQISLERGLTCFFSRSRQELWLKGETSGNYQHIVSVTADCDRDALVVMVKPDGPACHTGEVSCFHDPVWTNPEFT